MSQWNPPTLAERIETSRQRAAEAQADRAAALAILASPFPYPLVRWARSVVERQRVGPFFLARRITTERAA